MGCFKTVKYIIFDMDGLLLDTERIYYETHVSVLKRYGVNYTKDIQIKVMGTVPKDTYRIFIEEFNLPDITVEELEDEMKKELVVNMKKAELMPGVEKLVTHFKKHNIPMAVATSSDEAGFYVKTEKHKSLFDNFNHVVLGSVDPEVKFGKPAPDIYLVCASRFPQKPCPSEALVFEDAPNGVKGAVAAGMQVVMVPDPIIPEEKRKLATKVISSLLEFKPEEFGLPKFD